MKIAIDISQIQYGTGVSNYVKNLISKLLEIDKQNIYLLFGTSLRQQRKLKEFAESFNKQENLEFKFLPFPLTLVTLLLGKLRIFPINKYIGEVDVFHSSDWIEPRATNKTKKVTTVHDLVPYLFPESVHPKILRAHQSRLKRVKRESSLIFADSKITKEDLVKFFEIPEDKIKVVYLAAGENFKPQSEEIIDKVLEKYKITKPYILSVATQEPRKNIQKLINSFEIINKKYPDFQLVLTGKYGWGTKISYGQIPKDTIIWTGYVPEEDLLGLYSGCRVFAYPSLYEGFGLPVLEAMACGAPVVTSNNSSLAEIAKDSAILVDPRSEAQLAKAIEFVISLNLENYQKMVSAGIARAREFSWEKAATETLKGYEEAMLSKD